MTDLPQEEILAAVDRAVTELLAAAEVTGPPVDAVALARQIGVAVEPRRPRRPRPMPVLSEEQWQWAAAQTIARGRKADLLGHLGADTEEGAGLAGGVLANLFARYLLTPTAWFAQDARRLDFDLLALKERYRTVGHEAIALRWLDLPDSCVVTIAVEGRAQKRRSNAVRVGRTLSPAELECLGAVEAAGGPAEVRRDGWSVQGWPVPPAGGRRVILRGVAPDGDA